MNIIITRPLIEIENLMADLFNLGHRIIHIPTLKIEPIQIPEINFTEYDGIIFTSANAVRHIPNKNGRSSVNCFCVGSMTEKVARANGFSKTISANGTVNALKNLIVNSDFIKKKAKLAYVCGDNISIDLQSELKSEGFIIEKIINYSSIKINELNNSNHELIKKYPPDVIFVYSLRSAESFVNIVKNYSLLPMMTQSKLMCISRKIKEYFISQGWSKLEIFNPGDEILKLNNYKI